MGIEQNCSGKYKYMQVKIVTVPLITIRLIFTPYTTIETIFHKFG